jgi:Fic family protein
MQKSFYSPPYKISPEIVRLVSQISESIGSFSATNQTEHAPMLRRGSRIRSIHASLAIENNTLSLEQVTAVINGKRVLGHPREIQEVKNAFAAYEMLETLDPLSEKDLFKTHNLLMSALADETGRYRSGGVGIMKGTKLVHIAPPASRVPGLMHDLFSWLENTDAHPLIASSVFHYEFEFIHPFTDGNGRMGRLWQTLLLSLWRPMLAYLPVETVISSKQEEYYHVLGKSDKQADSTVFIEFMLNAILESLNETTETDQDSDQDSDQVKRLLKIFGGKPLSAAELMHTLDLSHRPTFRKNYLHPSLNEGFIEMTVPGTPNSRLQKYRITKKGLAFITSKH